MARISQCHREQLEGALKKLGADDASRTLTLQHVQGASWEFLTLTRYDSWSALAESEQKLSPPAATGPTSAAMSLQEHLAEHHDTVAERVTRTAQPRQP